MRDLISNDFDLPPSIMSGVIHALAFSSSDDGGVPLAKRIDMIT